MGQPVAVVEKPSSRPGMVRFEANRNLTGMGHERFDSPDDAVGERPAAVLARRLFDTGKVDAVHVYLNMVTVDLKEGSGSTGLGEILENLYVYYVPGFVPPPLEMPEEPTAASGSEGDEAVAGGESAASGAASRVPAHLLERSRLARERWFAKQG